MRAKPNLGADMPRVVQGVAVAVGVLAVALPLVCAVATASARLAALQSVAHPPDIVERVRALERAAIHGDRGAAGEAANWVAENAAPRSGPEGMRPFGVRVSAAASAVALATDVAGTLTATADLVASCGACHEAAKATPAFTRTSPPAFGSIPGHMVRHENAADLMLEGLATPSDAAWARGAGQLRETPLKPGDFPVSERIGDMMSEVETRLHAQAADAMTAANVPSRTRAYATLLTTCAECHTRHTTLWPQNLR